MEKFLYEYLCEVANKLHKLLQNKQGKQLTTYSRNKAYKILKAQKKTKRAHYDEDRNVIPVYVGDFARRFCREIDMRTVPGSTSFQEEAADLFLDLFSEVEFRNNPSIQSLKEKVSKLLILLDDEEMCTEQI